MADDSITKDAWFAGFTAGEGSFIIGRRGARLPTDPSGRVGLAPCFVIGLRADDLAILEVLRGEFGGTILMTPARGRNRPGAYWTISSKRDLARLIKYFDQFPLRAKKAQDYAIWRRAVRVYCSGGQRSPELWPLKQALESGRKYEADMQPVVVSEQPQLRLVS